MAYALTRPFAAHTIDERWHKRLADIGQAAAEIYTVLGPAASELAEARHTFVASGYSIAVNQQPTAASLAAHQDTSRQLKAFCTEIKDHETNQTVRRLYEDVIHELLANLSTVRAARANDTETFARLNEEVYGVPDASIANGVIRWLDDFVLQAQSHPHTLVRSAARRARPPRPSSNEAAPVLPDETVFRAVQHLHQQSGGYLTRLFADAPQPRATTFTALNGDPILRQVLQNIGSNYSIIDSPTNLWGVVHSLAAVLRPADYQLSRADFYDLVVHEIGSHTLERVNGERAALRLLATGLDRYDHINEGRAYVREQIMHDAPDSIVHAHSWQYHILIHVAIILAWRDGYDFAGVYNTIQPLALVWESLRSGDKATALQASHDAAWNVVTRALKGTDGTGGAYLKDIIYVQGNVRCWQAAVYNPDIIVFGDSGKFDFTRPDHMAALAEVGITPPAPRPSPA